MVLFIWCRIAFSGIPPHPARTPAVRASARQRLLDQSLISAQLGRVNII